MPLSATFAADFSSFTQACAKAEVSLKGIESGASSVESKLTRMGDSLSGTKIIQQATLLTEAVERVGGVSTLTANELQRVGTVATEAAEKLRVLGQEVPPGIQRIADASKAAQVALENTTTSGTTGLDKLLGSLGKVASAFGLAFGAGAVIGGVERLIGGAIEMASAIGDTSQKLGVSAEKLQGWNFAAEQAGASADDVSTAVGKMNANLDGGSKNTVDALKAAGLEFATIRNLKPEDAFETIATAIAKIPDPMTQARVAVELFGKGGQVLLPAIKDNFVQVGAAATKMSDEEVKSLKAAGDAWKEFGRSVTIVTGEMLIGVTNTITRIGASWKAFGTFMAEAAAGGVGFALAQDNLREAVEKAINPIKGQDVALTSLTRTTHLSAEEQAAAAAAAKKAAEELEKYTADLAEHDEVQARMDALVKTSTGTVGEYAQALIKAGASLSDVKAVTGLASGQLDQFKQAIDKAAEATRKAAEEQKQFAKDTETAYTTARRMTEDYTSTAERLSGNLLAAKLADNNRWFDDEFEKLLRSKADYNSYYAALDALRARKVQKDEQATLEEQQRERLALDDNRLLWDTYFVDVAKLQKKDLVDVEIRQVQDGLQKQLDALDRSKPDWEDQYDALVAIAAVRQAQIAQNYRDKALQPMIDDGVKLFDAALKGWDSFKTALEGIWQEMLHSFEEGLVKAMVDAWLGGLEKMAAAWTAGKWGSILGWLLGLLGGKGPPQDDTGTMPPAPPVGPGGSRPTPHPASRGGLVTATGIEYLQTGGPVWTPQGTDTVPAMLTPGERVLSVAEARRYRGSGGGGTVIVMLDGRVLAQAIVPEFEGAVRRLGFAR